mgnify:CR=1 FL=1
MTNPLNLNQAIRNLQLYLRTISFFDERIERVPIDGIFDSVTASAVASFQRTRGLPETAIVDRATWDAIFEEYLALQRAEVREPSPSFFPLTPYGYEAQIGETSAFVAIAQIMLRELRVIFDEIPDLVIDGIFGETTAEAVRAFQRASLLDVTGRIDLETYNRLVRAFHSVSAY